MTDRSWHEVKRCLSCGMVRTWVGEFNNTGKEAICCARCMRFIEWLPENRDIAQGDDQA